MKANIITKIAAVLNGFFGIISLFLWLNQPDYSSIWYVLYFLGFIYVAMSVFLKKLPLTPTLIFSLWVILDQTKIIANKPFNAIFNLLAILPIFLYSWKNSKK